MRQKRINEHGFSVMELLIVISIIGILLSLASLGHDFVLRERVTSTARQLLADLQRVRMEALTKGPTNALQNVRGAGINFVSSTAYNTFTFNEDNMTINYVYDGASEAAEVRTASLPSSLEITVGGAAPNNTILIYDRFGNPRDAAWGLFGGLGNTTILVRVTNNTAIARCISMSQNRIREGNWNGITCIEQ